MTTSGSFFSDNESAIVNSDRVLYTASSFARSSLLHLQEIGRLKAKRSHTSERSGLQSFLFFTVKKGSGKLVYDSEEYDLVSGSCVFINCQKPYSHTTDPDDLWTLQWCHFYGPTMTSIYDKYRERGGRPVFIPQDDIRGEMDQVLDQLMDFAKSSDYMRDMRINQLLSELMVCIMAESWHPEDKRQAPKRQSLQPIREFLDENYASKITLEGLCSQFYISKYYLTHSFKDRFGMSINSYLTNVRITHAKQMLRFSDLTVEEIAGKVGIPDPAYFSRLFKEVEGVAPSRYREQW